MHIHLLLLIVIFFSCSSNPINSSDPPKENLLNDRTYLIEKPLNYDTIKNYGLILSFHGAGGNGQGMRSIAAFETITEQYIIVYPDAKVENWEEGCMCNKPYRLGIDDIGFIDQLIDTLQIDYKINSEKIYAVGYSQGGLFVQNIACKLSSKVKAIVSVASPMSVPLSQTCFPSHPVSVMMIHGTDDSVLPYLGENSGTFSLISSPQAIRLWSTKNGAKTNPVISFSGTNMQIKTEDFSITNSLKIILVSPIGGGHTWSFPDFNTSIEILNFFNSLSVSSN